MEEPMKRKMKKKRRAVLGTFYWSDRLKNLNQEIKDIGPPFFVQKKILLNQFTTYCHLKHEYL